MNSSRGTWLAYTLAMILASILIHADAASRPVLNGDDDHYLLQSARIGEDFGALFTPKYHGSRPLTDLAFWLQYEVFGDNAGAFHAVILVLHGGTAAVLAGLCFCFGIPPWPARVAGILFLMSASHFRNVLVISGLSYHLALLAGFAACAALALHVRSRSRWSLATCTVGNVLAVLAHPAAVFVLAFQAFRLWRHGVWQDLRFLAPAAVLSVAVIAALVLLFPQKIQTYHSLHQLDPVAAAQQGLALLGRLAATAYWIPSPVWETQAWELWLGAAVAAALAWQIRRGGHEGEWAVWTALSIAPFLTRSPRSLMLGLTVPTPTGPSNYIHFAAAGMAVLLALAAAQLYGAARSRWGPRWGLAVVLGPAAALLLCALQPLRALPAFSAFSAGRYEVQSGAPDAARRNLQEALGRSTSTPIFPRDAAYFWLCRSQLISGKDPLPDLQRGLDEQPDSHLLRALQLAATWAVAAPTHRGGPSDELAELIDTWENTWDGSGWDLRREVATVFSDVASYQVQQQTFGVAIAAQQQRLRFSRRPQDVLVDLGFALSKSGDRPAARHAWRQAIELAPELPEAKYNLGVSYLVDGYADSAVTLLQAVVQRAPTDQARMELARALLATGSMQPAEQQLLKLLPRNAELAGARHYEIQALYGGLDRPQTARAFLLLGRVRNGLGRHADAASAYRRALGLDSSLVDAQVRLTLSLLLAGERVAGADAYDRLKQMDPNRAAEIARMLP